MSEVAPLRFQLEGGLPVVYRLEIANPNDHAVMLTAVELESIGLSGAYMLQKMRQTFRETIPAGATNSIDVRAWVQPLQQTHRGKIVGVVTLRGTATFDSMGKRGTASFSAQVKQ